MPAITTTAGVPSTERKPDPVAAGPIALGPRIRIVAPTASVVMGVVVVVAEAEEPDQPHDQQPDVEHPEADHEDPPLRGHAPMLARRGVGERLFRLVGRGTVVGDVGGRVEQAHSVVGAAERGHLT
jgi:hypothetical protein